MLDASSSGGDFHRPRLIVGSSAQGDVADECLPLLFEFTKAPLHGIADTHDADERVAGVDYRNMANPS